MLAGSADGGLVGRLGFATLAIIWLYSGWQAYAAVRRGDIATHRQWMMRNFALTFAAVTLRIHLNILTGPLEISFAEAYASVAWISWVPNLLIVEWFLLRRKMPLTNTNESARALRQRFVLFIVNADVSFEAGNFQPLDVMVSRRLL